MKPIWTEASPQRGYGGMWPSDAEYRALRTAKNMALAGGAHQFCACGRNCNCSPGWATEVFGETYRDSAIKKWAWVDRARNSYGFVSAIYVNDCAVTGTGTGMANYLSRWDGVPLRADLYDEPTIIDRQRIITTRHLPDLHIPHGAPPAHVFADPSQVRIHQRPLTLFGRRIRG